MKSAVRSMDAVPQRRVAGESRLVAMWALYGLTIRQHLHGKRWMVMSVLLALPAILALVIRLTSPDALTREVEFMLEFMLVPQALLPLVALVYAAGIIQDEQEEQTLTYLLIRPISKPAIFAVKLLATLTTTVALTWAATGLTYAAIFVGAEAGSDGTLLRCAKAAGIHSLAVIAYCCLFSLMSLVTRWTLISGILYTAIVEGLLANLPFGIRLITVIYYTRLIAYHNLDFNITVGPQNFERTQNIAADAWQYELVKDPDMSAHPTVQSCILILAGVSFAMSLFAAFLCARREFYVKTPETA